MAKVQALVTRTNLMQIPFTILRVVKGRNIREELGDIKELAASIKENGVRTAIRVEKEGDVYNVVAGHRRYAAAKMLYDKDGTNIVFPAMVMEKGSKEADVIFEMLADANSKELTVLELAEAVRRLIAIPVSEKDVALRINKTVTYVQELNRLAQVDKKILDGIRRGDVSATLVREHMKKGTLDVLLAELGAIAPEEEGNEEEVTEPAEGAAKKSAKKKVTAGKLKKGKENGLKNFKKFARNQKGAFVSTVKEKEFNLMYSIFLGNDYSYDDIVNYFNDGKVKE